MERLARHAGFEARMCFVRVCVGIRNVISAAWYPDVQAHRDDIFSPTATQRRSLL